MNCNKDTLTELKAKRLTGVFLHMVHEELGCKRLILEDGSHFVGLHFVLGQRADGRNSSFNDLKDPVQVYGGVFFGNNVLKEKVGIEEGIYLIIALHSLVGVPFDPESHDFLTYLRSYFMFGPSSQLTAKILTFRKALPLPST